VNGGKPRGDSQIIEHGQRVEQGTSGPVEMPNTLRRCQDHEDLVTVNPWPIWLRWTPPGGRSAHASGINPSDFRTPFM
jgi:hypothetical protein